MALIDRTWDVLLDSFFPREAAEVAHLFLRIASPLPTFCDVLATLREDRTHPRN
jgi:hypothetical protein